MPFSSVISGGLNVFDLLNWECSGMNSKAREWLLGHCELKNKYKEPTNAG